MGLFDRFKKKKKEINKDTFSPQFLYDEDEFKIVDEYIFDTFGECENVFHEIASPDIHLDVYIIEPSDDAPYYKLITMGAGAYRMQVPEEFEKYNINYAEYVIYLPKDWDIKNSKEEFYWPIRLLKDTARLPIWTNSWLAYGHTTQNDDDGSPYASNTRFNSIILNFADNKEGDNILIMPSGKVINFYEIIPLYPEELDFKLQNDANILFDMFHKKSVQYKVIDLNRKSAIDS